MSASPLPRFGRLVIAVYFFGAPLLLMVADTLHYYNHYLLAVIAFKIALVAFVTGSFGLAYIFPDREKYFGLVGTGLVVLGAITVSAMSTATLFEDLLIDKGYTHEQLEQLKKMLESVNALKAIYLPTGFAFPIGLVVLATGIARTPYVPTYIGIVLCGGAVLHTVARFANGLSLLLISESLLLIASALTGFFMWRYKPVEKG